MHVIHASDGNIPSDMATGDDDGIVTKQPTMRLPEPIPLHSANQQAPRWLRRYTKLVAASTLFLIFAGSDKNVTGGNVFVEFKDDVVSKSWRG